ncbi:hypothetical protein Cgig2_015671 [Carnegiea gigantea]|uniref:Ubiquitin-like protease family profile domain-containing protein n=1 Tax=Carnegiea gigantea TaxID=171969 RepID=A0A9Q1GG76_9CARY|nr:hypothetical protein Cgig2_015671 [Carnegiea gigantea]
MTVLRFSCATFDTVCLVCLCRISFLWRVLCRMLSNLTEGGVSDIVAIDVKGLVNVVPRNGPGDKAKDYCINEFAIDYYSSLLVARQRLYPKWCRQLIFAKTIELTGAKLAAIGYMLPSTLPKHMSESVSHKVAVMLTVMKIDIYTGASMWDLIHVDCPQQDNGHDCGVLVMIFMDLVALTGHTMCFNQSDIRTLRDKCLADILWGTIRNFPVALLPQLPSSPTDLLYCSLMCCTGAHYSCTLLGGSMPICVLVYPSFTA